jgi:hypothetical protein
MRGNSPVRFLGEGMAVTLFPYPTKTDIRAVGRLKSPEILAFAKVREFRDGMPDGIYSVDSFNAWTVM